MPVSPAITFSPAFYGRYQVDGLSPEELDEMLAQGWFRNDRWVYTAPVKFMNQSFHSSLMLRVRLTDFTWKKKLARLLRKNGELFRVEIVPFVCTEVKNNLWRSFKSTVHGWGHVPELEYHLLNGSSPAHFQMWDVCVYEGERLVAFSVFDRGLRSLASLEAAYDPAFSAYSLGIYTMLLEIEYALQQGMSYYYPGFFPRHQPMFEYKLRPGNIEFFRLREQRWVDWQALEADDWLLETTLQRLENLRPALLRQVMNLTVAFGFYAHRPGDQLTATDFNVLGVVTVGQKFRKLVGLVAWDVAAGVYRWFGGKIFFASTRPVNQGVRFYEVKDSECIGSFRQPEELLPFLITK